MNDDDLLATISELVLGYREGKAGDIISEIARIKTKATQHEANQKVQDLFGAIDDLCDLKTDIIENA